MTRMTLPSGQIVFDPRGEVAAQAKALAHRLPSLAGIRLGVLDNTKWNGRRLLERTVALLAADAALGAVNVYKKENFSRNAAPGLIARIARENDAVVTAIGD